MNPEALSMMGEEKGWGGGGHVHMRSVFCVRVRHEQKRNFTFNVIYLPRNYFEELLATSTNI